MDEKETKVDKNNEIKELTCLICSNVFLKPIKLACCNIILCECCLRMFVATNKKCAGCCVPMTTDLVIKLCVDKDVEDKVSHSFPLYQFFREKIQYVSEKQWWFDIHQRRISVTNLRGKLMELRDEKKQRLKELKLAFCNFIKVCKKECILKKTFERDHALLEKRSHLAKTAVPLTKDRCEGFASLPCKTCCLKSLTKQLEQVLCNGPDVLIEQHAFLEKIHSGVEKLPPCEVCKGDVMAVDSYLGGGGRSPRPCGPIPCTGSSNISDAPELPSSSSSSSNSHETDINEVCTSMETLLKLTHCPEENTMNKNNVHVITSESEPYKPNQPTTEELNALDETTLLKTCAKLFGQSNCVSNKSNSSIGTTCSSRSSVDTSSESVETVDDLEC
jgi:hypothetical protein